MRLEGRVAIITGAASGMGAATTKLFVGEGARVFAIDRPGTALLNVHAGLAGVTCLEKDITDEDAPEAIIGGGVRTFGQVDILVNNAGVGYNALAEVTPIEEWDRVLNVNLRSMFLLCKRVIPEMRERGYGRIVNISSVAALRPDYGLAAYDAAKAGVLGLTRTLALELGKFGITVNAIQPGPIYTGMTRQNFDQEYIRQHWERKTAVRRLGQAEDIANGVLFLSDEASSFVTGHALVVDGGQTLRM
ncbi:MAG: SDR family NAD(P)-dependent oxidoreductase [Dehalococcoidia bacterium]